MDDPYNIAVIGLWHCGEIFSAGLAELGHNVVGIDENPDVILDLQKGIPPLPEPDLAESLQKSIFVKLIRFSSDFSEIKKASVVWFTIDTPVNDDDDVDMAPIFSALGKTIPNLADGVLFVMTSQVPVGTAALVREMIAKERPDLKFDYVYTPENLRLGEAMKCFRQPDRVVVGADTEEGWRKINEIFAPLHTSMLRMSCASAEMAKHSLNAFLATSVSFVNDIADLCEKNNADVIDVVAALRSDPRIGPKAALGVGLGYSGGTLGRDLRVLQASAKTFGITVPALMSISEKNDSRKDLVAARLEAALGDLAGKKIALLGLTYKPGTKTLRRSRALEVALDLSKKGAALSLSDPAVDEAELPEIEGSAFARDPYAAARGAAAIVITTPWPEFKDLDFARLAKAAAGAILLDTANLLYDKEKAIKKSGLRYMGVGR